MPGKESNAGNGSIVRSSDSITVNSVSAGKKCTAGRERRIPEVLVETAGLSKEEWLEYRRQGIGGGDVAALMGISPFRTARDLYYDKILGSKAPIGCNCQNCLNV